MNEWIIERTEKREKFEMEINRLFLFPVFTCTYFYMSWACCSPFFVFVFLICRFLFGYPSPHTWQLGIEEKRMLKKWNPPIIPIMRRKMKWKLVEISAKYVVNTTSILEQWKRHLVAVSSSTCPIYSRQRK
jgi:hypothetical protein